MFQFKFWSDCSYHEFAFISWFWAWCASCHDDIFPIGFKVEKVSVMVISIDLIICWWIGKAGIYLCRMHIHLCFRQFLFWFAIFFVQHEHVKHDKCVVLNFNIIFMDHWGNLRPHEKLTLVTSMLMTNVRDEMCWRQFSDVGDGLTVLFTNFKSPTFKSTLYHV